VWCSQCHFRFEAAQPILQRAVAPEAERVVCVSLDPAAEAEPGPPLFTLDAQMVVTKVRRRLDVGVTTNPFESTPSRACVPFRAWLRPRNWGRSAGPPCVRQAPHRVTVWCTDRRAESLPVLFMPDGRNADRHVAAAEQILYRSNHSRFRCPAASNRTSARTRLSPPVDRGLKANRRQPRLACSQPSDHRELAELPRHLHEGSSRYRHSPDHD
jgi:hypothetical protein